MSKPFSEKSVNNYEYFIIYSVRISGMAEQLDNALSKCYDYIDILTDQGEIP